MEIVNVFEEDGIQTRSTVDSGGNVVTSMENIDKDTVLTRAIEKLLSQLDDRAVVSTEDINTIEILEPGIITNKLPLGGFTSIQSSVGVGVLTRHLKKILC